MKFTNENMNGVTNETYIPDDADIDEVLEELENFLRGSGYVITYDQQIVLENMVHEDSKGEDDPDPVSTMSEDIIEKAKAWEQMTHKYYGGAPNGSGDQPSYFSVMSKDIIATQNACVEVSASDVEYTKSEDKCAAYDFLVTELFELLDREEETDEGRVFRPNVIRSCRSADVAKIEQCLLALKVNLKD